MLLDALNDSSICWCGRISFSCVSSGYDPLRFTDRLGCTHAPHPPTGPDERYLLVGRRTCVPSHVRLSVSRLRFFRVWGQTFLYAFGWLSFVVSHAWVPRTSLFRFVLVWHVPSVSTGGARGSSWLRRGSLITTRKPPAFAMVGDHTRHPLSPRRGCPTRLTPHLHSFPRTDPTPRSMGGKRKEGRKEGSPPLVHGLDPPGTVLPTVQKRAPSRTPKDPISNGEKRTLACPLLPSIHLMRGNRNGGICMTHA